MVFPTSLFKSRGIHSLQRYTAGSANTCSKNRWEREFQTCKKFYIHFFFLERGERVSVRSSRKMYYSNKQSKVSPSKKKNIPTKSFIQIFLYKPLIYGKILLGNFQERQWVNIMIASFSQITIMKRGRNLNSHFKALESM